MSVHCRSFYTAELGARGLSLSISKNALAISLSLSLSLSRLIYTFELGAAQPTRATADTHSPSVGASLLVLCLKREQGILGQYS